MFEDIDNAGHQLESKAATAFLAMHKAAVADGVNLIVNSAWRDPAKQKALYAVYAAKLKMWETAGSNPASKPTPVALPGTSEHETGNAVDINEAASPRILPWLIAHSTQYGFYFTATGERWHLAYYAVAVPARLLERHRTNLASWI